MKSKNVYQLHGMSVCRCSRCNNVFRMPCTVNGSAYGSSSSVFLPDEAHAMNPARKRALDKVRLFSDHPGLAALVGGLSPKTCPDCGGREFRQMLAGILPMLRLYSMVFVGMNYSRLLLPTLLFGSVYPPVLLGFITKVLLRSPLCLGPVFILLVYAMGTALLTLFLSRETLPILCMDSRALDRARLALETEALSDGKGKEEEEKEDAKDEKGEEGEKGEKGEKEEAAEGTGGGPGGFPAPGPNGPPEGPFGKAA